MTENTPGSMPLETGDAGDTIELSTFAERAYLDYAISVVKGRALPDGSDGQKPVQRRILYAMHELSLSPTAKPRKSAAVVGDVLGRLHPHGDQSVYDAMVRMAQDFTLRYPLVDGHGNFGSRDGDGAAAMRYTEARLTETASLLLSELEEGTVDFQKNYDGSADEPTKLPARLPFTLLNGSSGIAVGMATEIPPHNIPEVADALCALIDDPDLPESELTRFITGPDFPGGGQIISAPETIADVYRTGRGSLAVRCKWKVEELARGQWQAVVTELPPHTSAQRVIEEIEELTNPKPKAGKKTLTNDQNLLKTRFLSLIDAVRDESSREAPVRLVLEPKSRRTDPDEFMSFFLTHTSLEQSCPVNLVMIGNDGRPAQKNLKSILTEWIDFRNETVRRRTAFRLDKINARMHILEGRLIVLTDIDAVIAVIRESDDPKPDLIAAFGLTEIQADDILEIRLRQLARLEKIKIESELAELAPRKEHCERLLSDEKALKREVRGEIKADAKKYGDGRRTAVAFEKKASAQFTQAEEDVTVIVSRNGWLRQRNGHNLDLSTLSFRQGDELYGAFECRSTSSLLVFMSSGRILTVAVSQLPGGRAEAMPVSAFADIAAGDSFAGFYAGTGTEKLLLATDRGFGFTASFSDMTSKIKAGRAFITAEGANILPPKVIREDDTHIAVLSEKGRMLLFETNELRELSAGGKGVILMGLEDGEKLMCALPCRTEPLTVTMQAKNGSVHTSDLTEKTVLSHVGKRSRKGKALGTRFKAVSLAKKNPAATAKPDDGPEELSLEG